MQKMITAVVFASVVALSGVALAAPATPRMHCNRLTRAHYPR
jgi:hypothetical protein